MSTFVHLIFLDGATIVDGLCPSAVARMALANKELQQLLMKDGRRMWWKMVSKALPGFEVSEELFERPHEFLKYFGDFRKAIALPGPPNEDEPTGDLWEKPKDVLRLKRLEDARKLQDRLRIAEQIACEHLANGGQYAKVFLAPLVLPELHQKARFWMEESEESSSFHPDLVLGQPIVVPADQAPEINFDDPAAQGLRWLDLGDIEAPPTLQLHFARLQHQLLMAARDDNAPPELITLNGPPYREPRRTPSPGASKVTVDISIADMKHQLFHVRGITMNINGPWVDCCGLYAPPSGKDTFAPSDPAAGEAALSIVCIRDDGVERPTPAAKPNGETFGTAKLPDALHLDCLRGRPYPR